MARKSKPYFFAIEADHLEGHQPSAILDMLRYDAAKVEGREEGYWIFSCENSPTLARWASFHIRLGPTITHEKWELIEAIRRRKAS